jgi:hypothetical protein
MWPLAYGHHEDRTPTHGYEPTREAAMAAFAKSWRRRQLPRFAERTPQLRLCLRERSMHTHWLTRVAGSTMLTAAAAFHRQGAHHHEKLNRASPSRGAQ